MRLKKNITLSTQKSQELKVLSVGILSAFLCFTNPAFTQNYYTRHINVTVGMPTNSTQAVYQDNVGFMWFGTTGSGIVQYDGQNFVPYTTKDGLLSDIIYDIKEDPWGNLIIATDKGISIRLKNKFINYTNSKGSNFVNRIYLSKDSTLYFAADDGAYSFKKGVIGKINPKEITNQVRDFAEDEKGNLWIATVSGIYIKKRNSFTKIGKKEGLADDQINAIEYDKKTKSMWVAHTEGVSKINYTGIKNFKLGNEKYQNYILDIKIMADNSVWTSGFDYLRRIYNDSIETIGKEGIKTNSKEISRLMEDRFGNVWLATSSAGIVLLQKKNFSNPTYAEFDGLAINGLTAFNDNDLWVSTEEGAFKINKNQIVDYVNTSKGLAQNFTTAICTDYGGNLWLNNEYVGPRVYNGKKVFDPFQGKFPFEQANLINLLRDSTVLLSASGGIVLYKNGKWQTFYGNIDFPINIILDACEDIDGSIWITSNNGIVKFNTKKKTHIHYTTKNGLLDDINFSIECDKKGNIWFASLGKGIGKYNGKEFEYIKQTDGLGDNNTRSLKLDDAGNVWVGTVSGLSLIKWKENTKPEILNFTKKDGLEGEPSIDAITQLKNGKIAIGSDKGLFLFEPENQQLPRQKPIIHIAKIDVNSQSSETEEYIKASEKQPVQIYLRAINYFDTEPQRFSYRLKGYSEEEFETETPKINLFPIPHGNYELEIYALDSWGNKSDKVSIGIEIIPPFWKEKWFLILMSMLSIASIVGIWKIQVKKIKRKETEKTNTFRRIAELEMKALKAQMNPHFVFNALNTIQNFIASGDQRNAMKYLSEFGHLIRLNLENSTEDRITIKEEIEFLKFYIEIEKIRFENKLIFTIDWDKNLDITLKYVPPMLIQPLVENAIKHGILPLGSGTIRIHFMEDQNPDYLLIEVEDDGIGFRENSEDKEHKSLGLKIIKDRLNIIGKGKEQSIKITDKNQINPLTKGTIVQLRIQKD